ncbi:hypothetical protein [Bifidobacterium samirii]|nr:hypothetical protein [Bifidobacterium samirii]
MSDADIHQEIVNSVGRYARTVVYSSPAKCVCPTCGGPKSSRPDRCWACQKTIADAEAQGVPEEKLANRVRLGYYAIEYRDRMYKTVFGYKEKSPTSTEYRKTVELLLLDPLVLHFQCLTQVAGNVPVSAWATVPSTSSSRRYGEQHPLNAIVSSIFGQKVPEILLNAEEKKKRRFSKSLFSVSEETIPDDMAQHVLLIEDSWVSGTTVQSAAAALKQAGAQQVSVFCVARILDLEYCTEKLDKSTAQEFREREFDQDACIWGLPPHPLV